MIFGAYCALSGVVYVFVFKLFIRYWIVKRKLVFGVGYYNRVIFQCI